MPLIRLMIYFALSFFIHSNTSFLNGRANAAFVSAVTSTIFPALASARIASNVWTPQSETFVCFEHRPGFIRCDIEGAVFEVELNDDDDDDVVVVAAELDDAAAAVDDDNDPLAASVPETARNPFNSATATWRAAAS